MKPLTAIAWNTFLEAIRERVLYLMVGFACFVFLASRLLTPLALGEGRRVTIDVGLLGLSVFGLLIVVFVGHALVQREIERGSAVFVFSRPVGRGAFVAGKYLGLAAVLALSNIAMGTILIGILELSGYPWGGPLVGAILLIQLQVWILGAIAILFASLCSPILAGLLAVAAWVIGNAAGSLVSLAGMLPESGAHTVRALLWLVPRLDLLNATGEAIHGHGIEASRWLWSIAYAALYAVGSLLLARIAFSRRSLLGGG